LRAIQSITDAALSRLDDRDLLAEVLERTRDALQADTAAVLLLDYSSGQLVATAAAGLEEEVHQGVRIPVGRGSGVPAAVIMGRMRSVLRAYALETRDPAEVLDRLDRKMQHFEPDAMATVLYAVIEPGLGRMDICLAGHFPPVIAYPGQPAELAEVATGMIIGIADPVRRPVTTVPIPPGALVCFYTDGLIEHPGEVIDEGLTRLCQAVTAQSPEAACAAVMQSLIGSGPARDDIALLMVRRQADHAGGEG
jgi:sigma-B regulation protein RsbU (phosphoserine phosphatase)